MWKSMGEQALEDAGQGRGATPGLPALSKDPSAHPGADEACKDVGTESQVRDSSGCHMGSGFSQAGSSRGQVGMGGG